MFRNIRKLLVRNEDRAKTYERRVKRILPELHVFIAPFCPIAPDGLWEVWVDRWVTDEDVEEVELPKAASLLYASLEERLMTAY